MTERIESDRIQKLRQLHHQLQNCLNVISLGTDVLADSRNDDATFTEFYETIRDERKSASKLLDEFLKTACAECG